LIFYKTKETLGVCVTLFLRFWGATLGVSEVYAQTQVIKYKIKDLAEVKGVRKNPLVGFGLVVGLAGTGDSKQVAATNRAMAHALSRMGMSSETKDVVTKNAASVVVTSELPPFAKVGDSIEVRVSSLGDATSLEGGTLLLTQLKGADNLTYAVAQGMLSQGSAMSGNNGGTPNRSNVPKTVATSFNATVEREFETQFVIQNKIELSLKNKDFTTANRVSQEINSQMGKFVAQAVNSGTILIEVNREILESKSFDSVAFLSWLEQLEVVPDQKSKIVINELTGTVVAGSQIVIQPIVLSHGGLQIQVGKKTQMVGTMGGQTQVQDLVKSLNDFGVGPKDLVAIMYALKSAGAINAEIEAK
jgi:flagellar P-ring protein precursor FlgI